MKRNIKGSYVKRLRSEKVTYAKVQTGPKVKYESLSSVQGNHKVQVGAIGA